MGSSMPVSTSDGVVSRLFAIMKDHEDSNRRLEEDAKGFAAQLQNLRDQHAALRDEHTALSADNGALRRCLSRAGVVSDADFHAELKGRPRRPSSPSKFAFDTSAQSYRGRSPVGDSQPTLPKSPPSPESSCGSPDPYALIQKLIDDGIDASAKQTTVRAVQRALKNPEAWRHTEPPLSLVVKAGRPDLVRIMIRSRADPSEGCPKGVMPLHVAAFEGNASICRILLQARAQVNDQDQHGQSPIFFAPTPEVCKLLVENRANLSTLNSRDQSALHLAGRAGLREVLDWLSVWGNPGLADMRDSTGLTAHDYLQIFDADDPSEEANCASPDPLASFSSFGVSNQNGQAGRQMVGRRGKGGNANLKADAGGATKPYVRQQQKLQNRFAPTTKLAHSERQTATTAGSTTNGSDVVANAVTTAKKPGDLDEQASPPAFAPPTIRIVQALDNPVENAPIAKLIESSTTVSPDAAEAQEDGEQHTDTVSKKDEEVAETEGEEEDEEDAATEGEEVPEAEALTDAPAQDDDEDEETF